MRLAPELLETHLPDVSGAPASLIEDLAGQYQIERELGRGGMATVYLARDLKHRRPVALKVLEPSVAAALGADRFLREVELAARLQHPHILTVFDSGNARGTLWFTMPYVEGETLRARLQRQRQLPLPDAMRIATEAARALDYAHQHGVLHRDVKPENLLLTTDGSTLVADFGIARAFGESGAPGMTETGVVLGTPAYMSPEQAAGDRALDERTDIYSLGCVIYEMLAGEIPYSGQSPQAILAKRLSEPIPHLRTTREVPLGVEQVVTKALAREPADRYLSAGALARAIETAADRPAGSGPRPTRAGRWLIGGGVLAILVVVALAIRLQIHPSADSAPPVSPASAAVLPFADLSEGKDQEYFSDGLTDELITALNQVDGIHVAARTSSFQFKGRSVDVREVGRKLDVGAVLEGSVRKSGNRVRISAQLVSARDGYQLWAQAYDRELADVFSVQEEIARAIIAALRVTLGTKAGAALKSRPTTDLQAYDLYLKGRFAWNQRTEAGFREAVQDLEQAVARDSLFAQAWAALAEAYILATPYSGAPRNSMWPRARVAASKALALDSTLGQAQTALAYGTMVYDWDWAVAESGFRRAIAVDPNYPTGHQWYGDFLWSRGRLDEALAQMKEAHRLDPISLMIGTELGQTYYFLRQYDQAETTLRQTLALDLNYPHALYILGLVHLQQGRYSEAIPEMERALELGGLQEDLAGAIAWGYGKARDQPKWDKFLPELEQRVATGRIGPYALALAWAGRGDLTRSFAYMNRALDERDIFVPEKFFDPMLDPLRSDPRFAQIEQRMGITHQPK